MSVTPFAPPTTQVTPGPCANGFGISPSDSVALAALTRYIYVGGYATGTTPGDIAVVLAGSSGTVTLKSVPPGTVLPLCALQVLSTGTTATSLVGLY